MKEYLAFVDEIGMTSDGEYIYRFDFTNNTDVVWGEHFNIVPAIISPNLTPDENCLSSRAKAKFPHKMLIAKKNPCFSMQDCIDGIISMIFSDLDVDDEPLVLNFGEEREMVEEKLAKYDNVELYDNEIVDGNIDNIINEENNE